MATARFRNCARPECRLSTDALPSDALSGRVALVTGLVETAMLPGDPAELGRGVRSGGVSTRDARLATPRRAISRVRA